MDVSGSSLFQGARQVPDGFWFATCCAHWMGVKLSLSGSAWWRRRGTRTGTREKAVVRPVSLPSSRTEMWGKLPGSPARLCARFLALVSWCPRCVGGPGLWPSVLVLFLGLVPSCGSGPLASSFFVHRVCFKKEATTQGTDPKNRVFRPTDHVQSGLSVVVGNEGRRPEDRSFDRYPLRFTWPWDWLLGYVFSVPYLSDVAALQVPSVAAAALFSTPLFSLESFSPLASWFNTGLQEWTQPLQ